MFLRIVSEYRPWYVYVFEDFHITKLLNSGCLNQNFNAMDTPKFQK